MLLVGFFLRGGGELLLFGPLSFYISGSTKLRVVLKKVRCLVQLSPGRPSHLVDNCVPLKDVGQGSALSYFIYKDNKWCQFVCSANKSSAKKHISKSHWSLALTMHNGEFRETTNPRKHRVSYSET